MTKIILRHPNVDYHLMALAGRIPDHPRMCLVCYSIMQSFERYGTGPFKVEPGQPTDGQGWPSKAPERNVDERTP